MSPTPEIERKSAICTGGLSNLVRVSVPIDVYFSLDKIQKVQKDILGRLGCLACCSGWDIRFDLERHFMVDERLNVRTVATADFGD
jgi:hypothetical protein